MVLTSEEQLRKVVAAVIREELSKLNTDPAVTDEFLSIKETCELIGISKPTLYKLINEGKIPSYPVGKRRVIKKSELLAALKEVNND